MSRSPIRSTALVAAVSLIIPAALLVATPAVATPAAGTIKLDAASPTDAQWAPDEASAQAIAAQFGHPVAVDSEASPTELVSALPDGNMQLEADSVPQRVKQGSSWVPVDTTLKVDSNDMFAPTASAAPVEFSVGGTDVIDKVQTSSGAWVTETWPYGALPSAVVEGSSVTYPGVLPGVDLRLTAAPGGVSEVLVVHDAQAAANPQLASLHLGVPDATVSVDSLAQVTAVKPDGSRAQAAAPTWWDSSDVNAGPGGPGGEESPRPLGDASNGSGLTLNIASALAGLAPVYPVFIDPEWTYPTGSPYWFTDAAYPNQSYLNGNYADGIQAVGNGGGYKSDAFWQFSLTKVEHAHIFEAVMNTTQLQTGNCSPTSISVAVYGPHTAGFTWNQEWNTYGSGAWGAYLETQNPNYGCPGVAAHSVGWTVTSAIVAKAAAGSSYIQLGLEPRYRTDDNSRRHYSQSSSLTIEYNHPPTITSGSLTITAPARGCGTAANPAYVNNGDPTTEVNVGQPFTLAANVSDLDGNNVNATFSIVALDASGQPTSTVLFSHNVGPQSAGTLSWKFPAQTLTDGHAYAWRVLAGDYTDPSAYSGWCYITDDATPPPLPTVSTAATSFTVGQTMAANATVNPAAGTTEHVWAYAYWWSDSSGTVGQQLPVAGAVDNSTPLSSCPAPAQGVRYFCTSDNNDVTLSVAPVDLSSTLWVAAYDKAGNVSVTTIGTSTVPAGGALSITSASPDCGPTCGAPSPLPAVSNSLGHWWVTDTLPSLPTVVPDANTNAGTGLSDEDDLSIASSATPVASNNPKPWLYGNSLSFSGTQTVPTRTSRSGVDTTQSFTVTAWLYPSSSTGSQTAVAQSGSVGPGFELGYSGGLWSFCVHSQNTPVTTSCVSSSSGVAANTWQLVTGVWDAKNNQVRIAAGSSLSTAASAPYAAPGGASATGPVTIGSGLTGTTVSGAWSGDIDDPAIFPGVIDQQQLASIYGSNHL